MFAQPIYGQVLLRIAVIAAIAAATAVSGAANSALAPQEHEGRKALIARQRQEKARRLEPEENPGLEKKLLLIQEKQVIQRFDPEVDGVLPRFGSAATGQGFGLGLQYRKRLGKRRDYLVTTSVIATAAEAWRYDLGFAVPSLAGDKIGLEFQGTHRDLTRMDFYGLGQDSRLSDRASYKLEDTSFDGRLAYRPFGRILQLGLTGGALLVNVGSGNRPGVPSIEEAQISAQAPGLLAQTNFLRYGGFAAVDTRDNPSLARKGALAQAALTYYDDRDLGRHDFRKLEVEAQKYFGFFNKRRVVVLRARGEFNYANGDQALPFYLKPIMGGPTELRGFRNYRFYDDNLLVLNAEYRWEAFSGLDMALFFDTGQVVAARSDFALNKMESAAGFGFRFNARNATFMRLDVGFSREGPKIWLRFGNPF